MKELADTYISELEVDHPLQRQILEHFKFADQKTYTELLPDGMSGNAFNYHLRNLVKLGLIAKTVETYTITARGKLVLDTISIESTRFKIRPVSSVFLYAQNPEEEILMYRSFRQPLIGVIELPFGKHRLGEEYLTTLNRILRKRNLPEVTQLPDSILVNARYFTANGDLIAHRTGPCFFIANSDTGTTTSVNGESFWQLPLQPIDFSTPVLELTYTV